MSVPGPHLLESPGPELVARVCDLIREGKPLTAFALVPGFEKVAGGWTDAKALTTAARLVERLGNSRLAETWYRINFRRHPGDSVCFLHRMWSYGGAAGYPRALHFIRERLKDSGIPPRRRADLLFATSGMLAAFRDFERAHEMIQEGLSLAPGDSWGRVCQAAVLRREDRRVEALEIVQEVLVERPAFGAAIQTAAELLVELNRDDEAGSLLLEGCERTEIADIRWDLYVFYSERENPDAALRCLEEYERLSPLLTEKSQASLHRARANVHLLRGDLEAARTSALAAEDPVHEKMAAHLAAPGAATARRVRVPVGFVRQNHMTCAPATLAALAAYWGVSAPHPEIADKICYDGTSSHSQRKWVEEQGLDGREFTVTPELTRQLIDRGVPFTLVTTWTTGAHLQAVVGTDDRAGLLIIRDPTHAHYTGALLDGFIENYSARGPRGMLVMPEHERSRVEGLLLPEAEWYDLLHSVEDALQRHDRALAQTRFEALRDAAPDHRLTWTAQISLACYDDDPLKNQEALTALERLFPKDEPTVWQAFCANSARRTRAESLEELERIVREPDRDAMFMGELARVLSGDARTSCRAGRLLWRLISRSPQDVRSLGMLANCLWTERAFEEALECYRLAACLAEKDESRASAYFSACCRMNRAEQGLAFLRRRVEAFGHLAAAPWVTLASSLEELLRVPEALEVIATARVKRPADGELLLNAAGLHRVLGNFGEAATLLEQAVNLVPDQDWRRQAATLAHLRGQPGEAATHWRAVLAAEPLAQDAWGQLARLTAETEGTESALTFLRDATMQWPWHMGLAKLYLSWLRDEHHRGAEAEVRRILAHNSADDWAWRELALELSYRERHAEAIAAAEESLRLRPEFCFSHNVAGAALAAAGRVEEAHAAYRRALCLDISCGAMQSLVDTAGPVVEKRRDIDFLRGELATQMAGGEAVMEFHSVALPHLSTEDMTTVLREGNKARPDIWETWSTLATHLLNLQDPGALAVTREMTERFPGAPGSWRQHSLACAQAGLPAERLAALRHASAISPRWSLGARDLAELHEREGRVEEALREMERMVAAQPLDAANHGTLAAMLIRQGREVEAVAALRRAVQVHPGYDYAWGQLPELCRKTGEPNAPALMAKQLTDNRPDEPRSFIVLTETLYRLERYDEALAEADGALIRWPKNLRFHELRSGLLKVTGRMDEALEACRPAVFEGNVPRQLRCRYASLLIDRTDYGEAERVLETLILEEPDFSWPRSLLYDIHRLRGNNKRCLELARGLVRIEPGNAVAAGMLAESLTLDGKTQEALPVVRRALDLDPEYGYAAGRLFYEILEQRDFESARGIADLMDRFQKGLRSQAARARLALAEGRETEALEIARGIIRMDGGEAEAALGTIAQGWSSAVTGKADRLNDLIVSMLNQGLVKNPGISAILVKRHSPGKVIKDIGKILDLPVSVPMRDTLIRDLLYRASEAGLHELVTRAVRKYRKVLESSTQLWGGVTYLLVSAGKYAELEKWSRDWQSRKEREPWMMSNIGAGLECCKGPLAAAPAWRDVMAAGASNVWVNAAGPLAFIHAVEGRETEARRMIDNLSGVDLEQAGRFSLAMAKVALAAHKAGPGRKAGNRDRARAVLRDAGAAWPGGAGTERGRNYYQALRTYLSSNRLDPVFGKPRDSRRPRFLNFDSDSMRVPVIALVMALSGIIKFCNSPDTHSVPSIRQLPTSQDSYHPPVPKKTPPRSEQPDSLFPPRTPKPVSPFPDTEPREEKGDHTIPRLKF